jgi:hypothetical protein
MLGVTRRDRASRAVSKPEPEDESADVPSFDHVIGHHTYSNGSIRMSG